LLALPFIFKRDISTIKKLAYIGVASVLFNVSVVVGTSFFGTLKFIKVLQRLINMESMLNIMVFLLEKKAPSSGLILIVHNHFPLFCKESLPYFFAT
jgi:hypothetical protein